MTNKELQIIMERATKEAEGFYSKQLEKERRRENNEARKELDRIRNEVYELNKEVGFYGIVGMEYKEFLEAMKGYSYEERMRISFAMLQHIAELDDIVFDEEGEE